MALQQPTRRQHDVALAILKYQNLHGQSPTLKELAQTLEIATVSSIYQHLTQLKKKGWVTWQPHGHRSLRFTDQGAAEAVIDLTHTCT
jgi:SOS-response transcriptional repressor LexA